MSLVVTGATGCIGSRVTRTHPKCGWKVYCLVRPGNAALRPCLEAVPLEGDAKHPCAQSKRIRPDVAFNLAANAPSVHRSGDVEGLLQGNMNLGVRQLEALSVSGGSGAVFMDTSRQHDSGADYSPVCLYAANEAGPSGNREVLLREGRAEAMTLATTRASSLRGRRFVAAAWESRNGVRAFSASVAHHRSRPQRRPSRTHAARLRLRTRVIHECLQQRMRQGRPAEDDIPQVERMKGHMLEIFCLAPGPRTNQRALEQLGEWCEGRRYLQIAVELYHYPRPWSEPRPSSSASKADRPSKLNLTILWVWKRGRRAMLYCRDGDAGPKAPYSEVLVELMPDGSVGELMHQMSCCSRQVSWKSRRPPAAFEAACLRRLPFAHQAPRCRRELQALRELGEPSVSEHWSVHSARIAAGRAQSLCIEPQQRSGIGLRWTTNDMKRMLARLMTPEIARGEIVFEAVE